MDKQELPIRRSMSVMFKQSFVHTCKFMTVGACMRYDTKHRGTHGSKKLNGNWTYYYKSETFIHIFLKVNYFEVRTSQTLNTFTYLLI